MHTRKSLKTIVVLALVLSATTSLWARALDQKQDVRARRWASAFDNAPTAAAFSKNPYADEQEAVQAGSKLYHRHCAECHGRDAGGGLKAPGLRGKLVQNAAPGVLFWFLTNGNLRHGMPSWSALPNERRWQLVTYLKSLGIANEPHSQAKGTDQRPR
ncbi:MAG TPA: c-type cytochrome [Blastocatellia bacterium]|nr:c-type cytochrome [Blastocatellia bacterium]